MEEVKKDLVWLNSKWWYRLLKVIFIAVYSLVILVSGYLIWEQRPKNSVFPNSGKSTITCNSGKEVYSYSSLRLLGPPDTSYYIYRLNYLCRTGNFPDNVPSAGNPTPEFTTQEVSDVYGSWDDVENNGLLTAFCIVLSAWLIRGIFFYITTGKWSPGSTQIKATEVNNNE